MIKFSSDTKKQLLELYENKNITLEGNILKLITPETDEEFGKYISDCIEKDRESRKRRLEITKQIQNKNKELVDLNQENERINDELRVEVQKTEQAKQEALEAQTNAENNLDILQKKTQFELINTIVKMALFIIVGVGLTTTILYIIAMYFQKDTQIIGSTWSNMFGILLTNAFSIVGTLMGVKYANKEK
jgi:hypothetical protein